MQTVGMIGGIGPESTIDYYRLLIAGYRRRRPDGGAPSILIDSIDPRAMHAIAAGRLSEVIDALVAEFHKLAAAGADLGLIAANSPHVVFDAVQARSPIPLVSGVAAARDAATARGLRRLALLGTRWTMRAAFYPEAFAAAGITLVAPSLREQAYIHDKYLRELLHGLSLPATRDGFLQVIARLQADERIDGVVLGGTELAAILRDVPDAGLPLLDTTAIHVDAVLDRILI